MNQSYIINEIFIIMKLIITESQYDMIITNMEINEGGFLRSLLVKTSLSTIGRQTIKTLYGEILRVVPKSGVTTSKEQLKTFILRLNKVKSNVDTLKGGYIRKYGQEQYDTILRRYLFGGMDEKKFVETLKNVKNPNIKLKPVLGGGADHKIYQSQLHPDKIFKVELRPGEIDKWLPTFQSHPDIFPKTFKRTKIKSPDGKILSSVVVEKLNIAPFQKLWGEMENLLYQSQKNIKPTYRSNLEYVTKNIKNPSFKKQWDDFLIYSRKENPQISKKVEEFYKIVNKLYEITPNPDIRKFNFGYDKKGKLKSLDI
jgi:hypothetical protein